MNKIVLDSTALAKLKEVTEFAEICDDKGQVIGRFTPEVDKSIYAQIQPTVSEEELDRRSREGGGRSLPEIIADLERRA